mmetsp:Transcript_83398/g.241345  ORF Transcript_83398/g.241345 Transcript_83398/m.241345 type:complete len:461 (-) Transcript_83398:46-1428(-)
MCGSQQDWSWLLRRLESGQECVEELRSFLRAGGRANDVVRFTLGNREERRPPCPRSLKLLLEEGADPNYVDPQLGSPLLHVAAWSSTPEVAALLLEHGADIERGEEGVDAPPMNTALAAGNAPVAMLLLERRASATWKHKDGATALHVALAWICDDARAGRRIPPLGDEPFELVSALLRGGADPSLREGMRGLTAVSACREALHSSPWLQDPTIGEDFRLTAEKLHRLLTVVDEAMQLKAKGNTAFSGGKHERALEAWGSAREKLDGAGLSGHHLAVLWSNEANCRKKMGDIEGCRAACEAGLAQPCAATIRAKLEFHLKTRDAVPPAAATARAAGTAAAVEKAPQAESTASRETSKTGEVDGETPKKAEVDGGADGSPTPEKPAKAKAKKTQLKSGFLQDIGESETPMYGPEGSKQGKNHSDLVWVPVRNTMQQVPYGKVLPIEYDHREIEKEDAPDSD